MRPANQTTESRAIRYTIGAGISVLALMLFSQLSCSIMGYCADWFGLPVLRFWEVLGIATALLLGSLALRLILRPTPAHTTPAPSRPTNMTDHPFSSAAPSGMSAQRRDEGEVGMQRREGSIQERTREKWQAFCERLSDEEKRSIRSVLEKRVLPTPPASTSSSDLVD